MSPPKSSKTLGGFECGNVLSVPQTNKTDNAYTWADCREILFNRYVAGGHSCKEAEHFASGEIRAILTGNHWSNGKRTIADPRQLCLKLSPGLKTMLRIKKRNGLEGLKAYIKGITP